MVIITQLDDAAGIIANITAGHRPVQVNFNDIVIDNRRCAVYGYRLIGNAAATGYSAAVGNAGKCIFIPNLHIRRIQEIKTANRGGRRTKSGCTNLRPSHT